MANYQIETKDVISQSEVLDEIKKRAKDVELTYREEKVKEFLTKNTKLSVSNFKKAFKEIKELNLARLEDEHIVKILDIMPNSGTELRSIVSHSGTVLVDESVTQILDIVKKYQK